MTALDAVILTGIGSRITRAVSTVYATWEKRNASACVQVRISFFGDFGQLVQLVSLFFLEVAPRSLLAEPSLTATTAYVKMIL